MTHRLNTMSKLVKAGVTLEDLDFFIDADLCEVIHCLRKRGRTIETLEIVMRAKEKEYKNGEFKDYWSAMQDAIEHLLDEI